MTNSWKNSTSLMILLFGGDPPLFSSQRELARWICDAPTGYSGQQTVTVYLNQVLRGKKPCSDSLGNAITYVVKQRIADQPDAVRTAIESKLDMILKIKDAPSSIRQLAIRQRVAADIVVISPHLELGGHPSRSMFMDITLQSLIQGISTYTFVTDKAAPYIARGQWRALLTALEEYATRSPETLRQQLGVSDEDPGRTAETAMSLLVERKRVMVYEAPSEYCMVPTVAYDSLTGDPSVYVWDWRPADFGEVVDTVARLNPRRESFWPVQMHPLGRAPYQVVWFDPAEFSR